MVGLTLLSPWRLVLLVLPAALLVLAVVIGAPVVEDPNDPAYLIGKELRCPVCQAPNCAFK